MKTFCPYRIAPLGAHIDHQYGIVCGAAINLGITFDYEISNSQDIILASNQFSEVISFNIKNELIKNNDWADYIRGVVSYLKNKYELSMGVSGKFVGDLPSGGISSSASFQIAFLLAICNVNNISLTEDEIINIVYSVERDYMNLSIGKLDPSCEVLSKKNSLAFLDTLTNYHLNIKNEEYLQYYQFVVIYSGVRRNLKTSEYNNRVNELSRCYDKLNISNKKCMKLRDIPNYYFEDKKDSLNNIEFKRANHYFTEFERVKLGLQAWRNNDMTTFGRLMFESCESSIKNYESGSEYLIDIYNITKEIDGILGFRFLGAGFNGSSLALIESDKFDYVNKVMTKKYLAKHPDLKEFKILPISLCDGVSI